MCLPKHIIHIMLHLCPHLTYYRIHQLHQHLILLIGILIIGKELCAQIASCKGSLNINGYTVLFCSDKSLLQEGNSLSADLSSSVHLRDATGQPGGSARSTRAQSHNFASSNPLPTSQSYRADQQLHSSSHGRGTHPTVPITYGGFNPPNYPQQSHRGRHGHQFLQPRYNQPTNSHMRPPMGSHQSGQPAWPPYGMGEGVPWGNFRTLLADLRITFLLVFSTKLS